MINTKSIVFVLCVAAAAVSQAQIVAADSVTVVPGNHYQAGPVKRFLLGDHWRDIWAVPVTLPVLDLERTAGGLTPTKRGGGFQTRSLQFVGGDGKEYKFRSLDKDPGRLLPEELLDTFVKDLVQDQISWTHPFSAVIAAPIVDAAGLLQATPRMVVLPDSPVLGEFRKDFGGLLGTIEENPDDKGSAVFAGADKIKGSYALIRELNDDNDEIVDANDFLTARLVDIFIGDWDRHVDQWKWAGFKKEGKRIWRPIPRDRDQALAKIDGFIPWLIVHSIKQIESYENIFPLIDDLTWSGRHLDRRFLSALSKEEWESTASTIVHRLTDSLISASVRLMPPEHYALEGAAIEKILRERRDRLRDVSMKFYELSARYVDIHCSNKNEYVEAVRNEDRSAVITVWKRDKTTGKPINEPIYRRRFSAEETNEIRIYLKDGDDIARLSGTIASGIDIHVDCGDGKDVIVDESIAGNGLMSFIPGVVPAAQTYVYDTGKKTVVRNTPSTTFVDHKFPPFESDTAMVEPFRDYGYDFRPLAVAAYNSADGIILGGGQTVFAYGFKYDPFYYRMDLSAAYATNHEAFRVDYRGVFKTYNRSLQYILDIRLSGIEVLRFFGKGNSFSLTRSPDDEEYYKVKQGQYIFHPQVKYGIFDRVSIIGGILLKHSDILLEDSTFITSLRPYGTDNMTIMSVQGEAEWDTRDHSVFPTKGSFIRSGLYHFPKLLGSRSEFTRSHLDMRTYIATSLFSPGTLALRLFAENISGTYPFFEGSFLGGTESVRGFEKQRFSGDASISLHAESRFKIATIRILLPFHLGGTLFAETGRVFVRGERSLIWHSGFGAGLWTYAVDKNLTVALSVARSREQIEGYVTTGFTF
ncbi:MAG: BamA/TamA family outer membrane protein [Bacteroidota bacterium]